MFLFNAAAKCERINANEDKKKKIKFWHVSLIYQSKSNVMLIFNVDFLKLCVALAFENVGTAGFLAKQSFIHLRFPSEKLDLLSIDGG